MQVAYIQNPEFNSKYVFLSMFTPFVIRVFKLTNKRGEKTIVIENFDHEGKLYYTRGWIRGHWYGYEEYKDYEFEIFEKNLKIDNCIEEVANMQRGDWLILSDHQEETK